MLWDPPSWLTEGMADFAARGPLRVQESLVVRPRVGEIRLVRDMDGAAEPRMILVVGVYTSTGVVEGALITNEKDMGTDWDVLLPAAETGLPFDAMAEADIVLPLFAVQCDPLVGRASREVVESIIAVRGSGSPPASPPWIGLPLRGPSDGRWVFKETELAAFQALAASCASWLMEGGPVEDRIVDPELLLAPSSEDPDVSRARVLRLSDLVSNAFRIPSQAAEQLESADSAYLGSRCASERLDPDLCHLVDVSLQQGALRDDPFVLAEVPEAAVELWPERESDVVARHLIGRITWSAIANGRRAVIIGSHETSGDEEALPGVARTAQGTMQVLYWGGKVDADQAA